jgi:hypothetical protein
MSKKNNDNIVKVNKELNKLKEGMIKNVLSFLKTGTSSGINASAFMEAYA